MHRRIEPGPGQESVWDYPRPPCLERSTKRIEVVCGGERIVAADASFRVLETSHPPTYYVAPGDVRMEFFFVTKHRSFCEWKGEAHYYDIEVGGERLLRVAWFYPQPTTRFAALAGYIALYPGRMDRCTLDGEVVQAQEGDFYGGWITKDIVGPFKGGAGTFGW